MIGRAALRPLAEYLAEPSRDMWVRVALSNGLKEIAERDPSARDDVVEAIAAQLQLHCENDADLNGCLIADLVELGATDQAPLMERAFAADDVDISVMGDWENVQVELGLLSERQTPRAPFPSLLPLPSLRPSYPASASSAEHHAHEAKSKRKARRKIAKGSRRKNRRKKK